MARTKKELKDQDTLLAGEAAEQAAEADASGTGLVPGGESSTPSPFDLELADGTPLDPNAPQTETNQEFLLKTAKRAQKQGRMDENMDL